MEWTNFHFDCLEPFLSCRDWVALSWCCKFFHSECNLKRTLLKKFKKQMMHVLNREDQLIIKLLLEDLKKHNGVISGGCALSVFCGDHIITKADEKSYGDIDIFYQSSDARPFDFSSTVFSNLATTEHTTNTYSQYHFMNTSTKFIHHIHNVKTTNNSTCLQFINTCPDYEVTSTHRFIRSQRDHVIGILFDTFDMEFCKIAFAPDCLEIFNLPSVVYRTSQFKTKDRLDELTKTNWRDVTIIDFQIIPRIQKYIRRGFTISNYDYVDQLARLNVVLYEVIKYERFMVKYNKKQEEERLKQEKAAELQRQKEEALKKAEDALVNKWMQWEFDEDEEDVKVRESHIDFHKRYVPIVEWVTDYDVPPKLVYLILVYGGCSELIGWCFDVNRIPREWMIMEDFKIRRIMNSTYPHVRISPYRSEQFFWKTIRIHWPRHIHIGESDDHTKDYCHTSHSFYPSFKPDTNSSDNSSVDYYMNYNFKRICRIR